MVGSNLVLYNFLHELYALDFSVSQERLRRRNIEEEQKGRARVSVIVCTNFAIVNDL